MRSAALILLTATLCVGSWSSSTRSQAAASDGNARAEALQTEVQTLQTRLEKLEKRMARCEAQLAGSTSKAEALTPSFIVEPAATADPADGLPGAARPRRSPAGLPATGQTLAAKLRFLEGSCLKTVRCAGPLVQRKQDVPGMQVDETRRFSSLVGRCAHQCAVEIAVSDAVARSPSPPAPDDAVGLRTPGSKGLPGYPGEKGELPALRDFLDVRCRDVACARLSLSTAGEGAGPAVLDFLRTCAKACAEQKNLGLGQ